MILDTASDETFAMCLQLPPDDHRTIEEFAAAGVSEPPWRTAYNALTVDEASALIVEIAAARTAASRMGNREVRE